MIAYDDVRRLTAARLLRDLGRLPRVIVASPPCQDISSANAKGQGVAAQRSGLFFEWTRLVREIRPVWACAENSPNLRTRGADRVLSELEGAGYTCWPLVVGAVHAGAPHRRQRAWLVAADLSQIGCGPRTGSDQTFAESSGGTSADTRQERREPSGEPELRQAGEKSGTDAERRAAADADGAGLAIGGGERGDPYAELPPIVGAIGQSWPAWNGSLAAHYRLDAGLPAGLARKCVAAYGDSVVPQITEAIGRSMTSLAGMHGPALDLFTGGAAGWSLGMTRAGYDVAAICEIDPWRRAVAVKNHGRVACGSC